MAYTYEPIATNTLVSNTATVTFSSISGSYTDLYLVATAYTPGGDDNFLLNFNGDTGTNYSVTRLYGDGTSTSSSRGTNQTVCQVGGLGNYWTMVKTNIMNYSNSTTYKTTLTRNDRANSSTGTTVNLWRSTTAITSIVISTSGNPFGSGSTFTLYGIKAA